MIRDERYNGIKSMVADGTISYFTDIFKYIPKTIVAKDLGKKVDRFTESMNQVKLFSVGDLFAIAELCKITEGQILKLIENEYLRKKRVLKIDK